MENQLEIIVKESGLEPTKADLILQKFSNFFDLAADWQRKAEMLVVTKEDQLAEMKMAREGRLFLKQKRVEVENTRKDLKEQSLREGKAIDGIANVLKALIIPIEDYLEQQEKFAEIQEANRVEALRQVRTAELSKYGWLESSAMNIGKVPEMEYNALLAGYKKAEEERIAEEKRIEAERIAKEKAEAEERERIKRENELLRKEAEEKESQLKAEREKAERERKEAEEKARNEREAIEAKAKAEREKAEMEAAAKLEAERKERTKIEAELQAKKQAEEAARVQREKEEQARIVAERKAAAAPDKEKLLLFIIGLSMPDMGLKTFWGETTEKVIREKFDGFKEWAIRTINTKENSLGL